MAISARKRMESLLSIVPGGRERRDGARIHTVLRVARVTRANDVGLWRVRNISDRGMMLETKVKVVPGESLSIHLSDAVAVAGKAIWWDGRYCGVELDEPIDCAATLERLHVEQRSPRFRPLRLPVAARATAYCERGLHMVKVVNLSPYGASFEHDGCFTPGMSTLLLFENGEEHRGVVRWSEGGRAGLYLTEPFPCARLESANGF